MRTYKTAEAAKLTGIHPNTVRLYEALGLIPKPERLPNGYRVFTGLHLAQLRLVRTAFQVEVLQNGLRRKVLDAVKASARGEYDRALALTRDYTAGLQAEQKNALEAIDITARLLKGGAPPDARRMKRHEVSAYLGVSMDCLRNWEMNGLLRVKRRENGYRIYTGEDIRRLKIIRSLRCGGYSLEAILRMLTALSENPKANVREALNTPEPEAEIIAVCDRLITSLQAAEENAAAMTRMLSDMKAEFLNPPL